MLKIKDNVDLKELEKFGFKKIKGGWFTYEFDKKIYGEYISLILLDCSRKLFMSIMSNDMGFDDLDIIYDLIKADLVVKVDE